MNYFILDSRILRYIDLRQTELLNPENKTEPCVLYLSTVGRLICIGNGGFEDFALATAECDLDLASVDACNLEVLFENTPRRKLQML